MFGLIGIPMLYAAYLNFQVQEMLFGSLMVGLFVAWNLVILMVLGFKIKISDATIKREGIISATAINFADVDAIHFGNTWSDFHLQADDTKLFISKDFIDHEALIQSVIDRIRNAQNFDDIELMGESENIEKFLESDIHQN